MAIRDSPEASPGHVLILIKLLQVILLIGVLGALTFGLYEAGMSVFHLARGVPVEGQVTDVSVTQIGADDRVDRFGPRPMPVRFPVISYSDWPPEHGMPRWIQSLIPRSDVSRGDTVTVRVVPGYENLARTDRAPLYYVIVAAALFGGLLFTWIMFSSWYSIDASFGRGPEGGLSIFNGPAGKVLIFGVGGPAVAILLFHFYFVPWMQFNEYVAFADRPGRLLYLAAERGGPPVDGPLNAYERRLLAIPGLRIGISQDALNRAFSLKDTETVLRYIDAIKDPDIAFLRGWPPGPLQRGRGSAGHPSPLPGKRSRIVTGGQAIDAGGGAAPQRPGKAGHSRRVRHHRRRAGRLTVAYCEFSPCRALRTARSRSLRASSSTCSRRLNLRQLLPQLTPSKRVLNSASTDALT